MSTRVQPGGNVLAGDCVRPAGGPAAHLRAVLRVGACAGVRGDDHEHAHLRGALRAGVHAGRGAAARRAARQPLHPGVHGRRHDPLLHDRRGAGTGRLSP
eukprot:2084336-Pyramimonas_sp.AAC.1